VIYDMLGWMCAMFIIVLVMSIWFSAEGLR